MSVQAVLKIEQTACAHAHVDLRALTCSNGSIQYVKQCLECGAKVGSAIKKADAIQARGATEFILPFDDAARERGQQALTHARRAAFDTTRSERKAWYDDYLRGPDWRSLRAKVIQRSRGRCEGCLTDEATEVHHLTYEHVGHELAFELVALCRDCHERAHARSGSEE